MPLVVLRTGSCKCSHTSHTSHSHQCRQTQASDVGEFLVPNSMVLLEVFQWPFSSSVAHFNLPGVSGVVANLPTVTLISCLPPPIWESDVFCQSIQGFVSCGRLLSTMRYLLPRPFFPSCCICTLTLRRYHTFSLFYTFLPSWLSMH